MERTSSVEDSTENGPLVVSKLLKPRIKTLKSNIDVNSLKDPLARIKEKVKDKNLTFKLKPVTVKIIEKI